MVGFLEWLYNQLWFEVLFTLVHVPYLIFESFAQLLGRAGAPHPFLVVAALCALTLFIRFTLYEEIVGTGTRAIVNVLSIISAVFCVFLFFHYIRLILMAVAAYMIWQMLKKK
jgi:hypothetical protein